MTIYTELERINHRPAPFEEYTAPELWTNEHTSSRMLEYHLNANVDVSSRKLEFIDRSAAWIVARFGLSRGTSVADLGCGPGLYTTRFARAGADVTGVDFSERSIRYAREQAQTQGISAQYVCCNYLEFEPSGQFDLVTLIMCDICALSPAQRKTLLNRIRTHLKPNGAFLFDVYSLCAFEQRREEASYGPNLLDGFWAAEPYFGFLNTFKYPTEKVVLDKYTIVQAQQQRTVFNWFQHFDQVSLAAELQSAGLTIEAWLGDVAGAAFNAESTEFGVIARLANR
jgi:2-polyprenyl-3-methyl-5-hydroxy-6-metoxy-1,4-benzoquinol methylase